MNTVPVAVLGALTVLALAVAGVATWRASRASAALRASEATRVTDAAPPPAGSLSNDAAHDLNDLRTVITGHAELLIASLDPAGPNLQDAREIRGAALSAARLTRPRASLATRASAPALDPLASRADHSPGVSHAPDGVTVPSIPQGTGPIAPILVVEDEPGVREFIGQVLMRAGHDLVQVAGPHAALAALARQPGVALMLVDIVMPEMDGYELAAEARRIVPGVRVILMSGFARDHSRHSDADGFLAKPFTADSLLDAIADALQPPRTTPG